MRTALVPALPILLGLFSGLADAQGQQTTRPPAAAGTDLTDPARMASDNPDPNVKPKVAGAPVDAGYIIGPEDIITVWVYQQPSMDRECMVRSDGMVSVPLIGEVKAGGHTVAEVEAEIGDKLKKGEIVVEPNVNVGVYAVHSKKVYIEGDGIARPGIMDLAVPTRVSEAIVFAGGFRDFAKKTKVRIIRVLPDGTVKKFMYNAKEVSQGKKLEQNILLQPGDHIYVDG